MRRVAAFAVLVCLGLAFLIGGLAPFGRVALVLGMPRLAQVFSTDPGWGGVAAYRAGDFEGAAQMLAEAGPGALYNLGNAQTQRGNYAAALEAYDLALARGHDPQAQANFDLLLAFYAGTAIDADALYLSEDRGDVTAPAPVAQGSARGAGSGDEVTNASASLGLAELTVERREQQVRQVFDDRFVTANDRWLATLQDVPGAYLNARIAHEHKRRRDAGIGQLPEDTEW
ncbi:tetratricopeptide repeat protein [Loktanella agnita]|uniref:tetratricopeptide repeat protein n=1 Tax=Loktanella agnita TaxID=287097 RepID=UPI0039875C09